MEDPTILDLIFELQKKCNKSVEEFLSQHGVSQAEYNMFICLKNCKHFNSYSVSEKMNLSLSRVSRIIDKMVNKNYLTRTTNKLDRRAIDIKITPLGKNILEKIVQFNNGRENHFLSQLNDKEVKDIKTSFIKLLDIS